MKPTPTESEDGMEDLRHVVLLTLAKDPESDPAGQVQA